MFEYHKKESPIISLLGMGGGIGSYIFTAADTGYEIARSLRFNSADSAYLSYSGSAGSNTTWTFSTWIKKTGNDNHVFGAGDGNTPGRFGFTFDGSDKISVFVVDSGSTVYLQNSDAVFRDSSAWYHVVLVADTTNGTPDDRLILYVNGVRQTLSGGAMPLNQNTFVNTAAAHAIGRRSYTASDYFNGYLADVWLIDGSALEPTSFGTFDTYGVWQPKRYTGSATGNSFHLPFSDNSSVSALGTDTSGNGNDWTVNNITAIQVYYSTTGTFDLAASNLFDNNTSTFATCAYLQSCAAIFSIPFTSSLRCYITTDANMNRNGGTVFKFTGGTTNTSPPFNVTYTGWYDFTSIGSPFTRIDWTRTTGSFGGFGVSAIEVDGQIIYSASTNSSSEDDSLLDSPTNADTTTTEDTGVGGEIKGNYCTWNAIDKSANITTSNGNLEVAATTSYANVRASLYLTSGKWYWELTCPTVISGSGAVTLGVATLSLNLDSDVRQPGAYSYWNGGSMYAESTQLTSNSTYTTGDIIGFALDQDANTLSVYKNGVLQTGSSFSGLPASVTPVAGFYGPETSGVLVANFGQSPFAYAAPSGFKALNTANLPTPTIEDPSTVMDVALWTGNGTSTTISGLGFSPDLVWTHERSGTSGAGLWNTVVGQSKYLSPSVTNAEFTTTTEFTSFNSDGFTVGASTMTNENGQTSVAWTWDAGTSNATNTSGSITSTVRANTSAGFSVLTYNAGPLSASTGATVGHGLGIAPQFIIIKDRDDSNPWGIYHASLGPGKGLLFSTAAEQVASTWWNNTAPTSSVFSINSDIYATAQPNHDYVAYCWAPVEGYSAFGSYTGNGSTDGPFVYTGFRPRYLLVKRTNAVASWGVWDSARDLYNVTEFGLQPNTNSAEYSGGNYKDFLSNGFKMKDGGADTNGNGSTYIYAAFAEHPFRSSRAR